MNIFDLHEKTWKQLGERRDRLPHALLLTGQRGIGKFELARAFAGSLLCENPSPSRAACGSCLACGWMAQGNHPDFRRVQPGALAEGEGEGEGDGVDEREAGGKKKKPSQQITIDQIRALDDFLHVGTHRQGARVVLLHPAEAMNRATANSLLKSLEEPAPGTLFLLVSNEPERLLPTIRSRCQRLPVPLPEASRAQAWLTAGGVKDAARWLALAGGSPLLAAELGTGDERALLDALVGELVKGGRIDPLAAAAAVDRVVKAEKRPAPLKRLVEWGQKWFVDLILLRSGQAPRYFLAQAAPLAALAGQSELSGLLAFSRKALQYRLQCEQPLNSRLFLEDFFLNYAALFESVRDVHG
ncbi:MAG: DNA polymerase III subunit delta' [Candidatus Accumulibacter sp.]|jgi:DNA polymerase-3 subunit delta'|nr:DNA polymerase III subunit delta' [Accumulibacter sp.]